MGTPHTVRLGAALRLARAASTTATGQPMTTAALAALLLLNAVNTGFFTRFSYSLVLAQALDGIEAGVEWPFSSGEERGFIRACAHALSGGNARTEQDLLYALSTAAAKDLLNP